MTIVSPMGQLRPVFADKNGKRLSGGKVFTYEPGTLTPKATYTDALNLIPNTNPIDLDESGEADIYLDGGYRMQVFDRYGALIQDVDNFRTWAGGIPAESIFYGSQDLKQFNTGVEAAIEDRYTKAETYSKPEIDTSLTAISGGHKAYATLAAALANTSTIQQNSIVEITNDGANNGTYQWNGADLTKSAYDPLTQAKNYTDEAIELLPIEQIDLTNFSFVIKDTLGRVAVGVLLDPNGKPSIYMLNSIFEGLTQKIGDEIVLKIGEIGVSVKPTQNGSFFVVDKNDQLSWFGVDENGLLPDYTVKCILDAIQNSGYSLALSVVKSTYQDTEIKAVSGANINCIGDSMTAGAGGGGTSYPSVLQTLLLGVGSTASVYNSGVGGETSVTITARVGGYPIMVRVTGGIIPATTTATNVTFDQINGVSIAPLVQGTGGGFSGTFAGVQGNFSLSSGQYRFTRATAGAEVVVNRPTPYVNDYAKARRGDITIIWIGQNGPSTERAIQDAKAIIQSLNTLDKRWLVISKPTATPADDALFFNEFGDRFIAAKKYMVEFGIYDAGITPTEQDLTDMANYTIPLPLCASESDRLHWSAAGYTVLANLIFKKLNFLGWI